MTPLNSKNSSNQNPMIKIINNVLLLAEKPNSLIDLNNILNEEFSHALYRIEEQIKTLKIENKTKIIINGTTDNYSFIIESKNEKIANLIQSIIDESTK